MEAMNEQADQDEDEDEAVTGETAVAEPAPFAIDGDARTGP